MVKKILVIGATSIATFLIGFLIYLGTFKSLDVSEQELGPYYMVYREHRGDYAKIGHLIGDIKGRLASRNIHAIKLAGIYYDDPRKVKKEDLSSDGGCLLRREDLAQLGELNPGLKQREIPRQKYLVTHFPFRNGLSIWVGAMKAYPALEGYAKSHGYKMARSLELYDDFITKSDAQITYMIPLSPE